MITGLGIASLACGAVAAVLWIPAIWVPWIAIVGIVLGIVGVIMGYLSDKAAKEMIPYLRQQAAQNGQPFTPPAAWGQLGLVVSGLALAITVVLFAQSFSSLQLTGRVGRLI